MKNKIKAYRIINNLTQAQLAKMANVRRETILYLEQNKYMPSLKLAYDVANILNTTIEKLFIFK